MQTFDPKKKLRPEADVNQGTGISRPPQYVTDVRENTLGARAVRAVGGFLDNVKTKQATMLANSAPAGQVNTGLPTTPSVVKPPTAPVSKPVGSTIGGGRSTPTGGVPAYPRPSFSEVRSDVRGPGLGLAPVPRPGDTNSFTFSDGRTVAVQPAGMAQPVAAPVARPMLSTSSIADVGYGGVNNPSEDTAQRRAREAAISEIGSKLFEMRGKTTRSARDLTGDLLRTQADLTNTAGNYAAANPYKFIDPDGRQEIAKGCSAGNCPRLGSDVGAKYGLPSQKTAAPAGTKAVGPQRNGYVLASTPTGSQTSSPAKDAGSYSLTSSIFSKPETSASFLAAAGMGVTGQKGITNSPDTVGVAVIAAGLKASADVNVLKLSYTDSSVSPSAYSASGGADIDFYAGFGGSLNYRIMDNGWSLSLDFGVGLGAAFKGVSVDRDLDK